MCGLCAMPNNRACKSKQKEEDRVVVWWQTGLELGLRSDCTLSSCHRVSMVPNSNPGEGENLIKF